MTKKHFVRIAKELREARILRKTYIDPEEPIDEITRRLNKFFKTVNENYDEERFLKASGYYDD